MLHAQTIRDDHADYFTYLQGDLNATAEVCASPSEASDSSLVYVSDAAQLRQAVEGHSAVCVVPRELSSQVAAMGNGTICFFSVPSVQMGMALLWRHFDHKRERFTQWGEHHPTAVVHETAIVGKNVFLGPYCVIGAGAVIGDGCLIGSHTVVENGAKVGESTILHPHVFLGADCQVGRDCEIHPHTSIGSDGFGYASGKTGRPQKIPHLGNVIIGDEVEIGSNCAIDRAKLDSTYIRSGAKLDNICHIAHNCDLGENGFYTAGFFMAGSTKIGKYFVTGGNSVVSAHLTLTDNVTLAGRSSVTADITEPGSYGGYPLQPLRDALRSIATIAHLADMRRNLNRVMKRLSISDTEKA